MKIALSFDIEDYHKDTVRLFVGKALPPSSELNVQYGYLLDRLEEEGIRATFFLLGSVAQHCPDLVRRIYGAGHEVAVHGFEHVRLEKLTPAEFQSDISRAMDTIQMSISATVLGYRAPFCSLRPKTYWLIDVLKELGFFYDSSFFPVVGRKLMVRTSPDVFQYPNGLYEVPLTVGSLAGVHFLPAGGGYFRLSPYSLSRWIVERHLRHYGRAVMYHHNYDFFDSPLSVDSHSMPLVMHNLNLWVRLLIGSRTCGINARRKFHRLLQDFDFCPLSQLLPTRALKQKAEDGKVAS